MATTTFSRGRQNGINGKSRYLSRDPRRSRASMHRSTHDRCRCDPPIRNISILPTNRSGGLLCGVVTESELDPTARFSSAKVLIINGPRHRGSAVRMGDTFVASRLHCKTAGGGRIVIDALSKENQTARSVFSFTHVAEINYDLPQVISQIECDVDNVFRTLSMIRGRWVGIVGPWFFADGNLHTLSCQVTKTERNGSSNNWYHETLFGVFEELYGCFESAYKDDERRECCTLRFTG